MSRWIKATNTGGADKVLFLLYVKRSLPPVNAVALICGPPVMIKFTLPVFFDLGFSKKNIITSLEMRMKCGIGKCGRCNVGSKYICQMALFFH